MARCLCIRSRQLSSQSAPRHKCHLETLAFSFHLHTLDQLIHKVVPVSCAVAGQWRCRKIKESLRHVRSCARISRAQWAQVELGLPLFMSLRDAPMLLVHRTCSDRSSYDLRAWKRCVDGCGRATIDALVTMLIGGCLKISRGLRLRLRDRTLARENLNPDDRRGRSVPHVQPLHPSRLHSIDFGISPKYRLDDLSECLKDSEIQNPWFVLNIRC